MVGEKPLSVCEMDKTALTEGSFFHISFDHSAFRSKSSFYAMSACRQSRVYAYERPTISG